jgi:hypothetical protein
VKSAVQAGLVAAMALMMAAPAAAHTNYMQPNVFASAEASQVTIESSFSEDFSRPEFPVESQDFHLYRPNGQRDTFDRVTVLNQMTALESDLTEPGASRFTTGGRLGRTAPQAWVNGQWQALEPGASPPRGARTAVRSYTTSLTFEVTR